MWIEEDGSFGPIEGPSVPREGSEGKRGKNGSIIRVYAPYARTSRLRPWRAFFAARKPPPVCTV